MILQDWPLKGGTLLFLESYCESRDGARLPNGAALGFAVETQHAASPPRLYHGVVRLKAKAQERPKRSVALTSVQQWQDGQTAQVQDYLAVEEPLEIRIGDVPISVTMRTPGDDLELAAGFLFTEGIIASRLELTRVGVLESAPGGNIVVAELENANQGEAISGQFQRNFFVASSCGICGKASIEAIRRRGIVRPNGEFRMNFDVLCSLPEKLRESQAVFGRTGGLHAAAAFTSSGELLAIREDIGRHNAVDKVIGWALLNDRLPMSQIALMVSGRGGFEIVQKSLAAEIPILASVSAPSSLAVQLAREMGMTLVGFLRGKRFVIYSGERRIGAAEQATGNPG